MAAKSGPAAVLAGLAESAQANLSIRAFLACAVNEFGGPAGMAKELRIVYDDSSGATIKANILNNLVRVMQAYGAEDNEDMQNVEELEALARNLMTGDDGATNN